MEIAIERVVLSPVKEHDTIGVRPVVVRMTEDDLNIMSDMRREQPGNLSSVGLSRELPSVVSVADAPTRVAPIEGGWHTARYRVMIIATSRQSNGYDYTTFITGYTDRITDIAGHVDDDTYIKFSHMFNMTSIDGGPKTIVSHFDLLSGDEDMDLHASRAVDIITSIEAEEYSAFNEDVVSISQRINMAPKTASSRNLSLHENMAGIINAVDKGNQMSGLSDFDGDVYSKAKAIVNEYRLSSVPIMKALSRLNGTSLSLGATLRELDEISSVDFVPERTYSENNDYDKDDLFSDDMMSSTSEITIEKSIGISFGLQTSALLERTPIQNVTFGISNVDGEVEVHLTDYNAVVPDLNVDAYLDKFLVRVEETIFYGVTKGGTISCDILFHTDVDNIRVGVDVGDGFDYTYLPKYASSQYNPIATEEEEDRRIVSVYSNILNER